MEPGSQSGGMTGITRDDWLKALADVGKSSVDDQGAVTVLEFAVMFNIPRSTASHHLRKLEAAGRAIRTQKRGRNDYGRDVRYIAYRLVQ